jgi:hypothetical protein
VSSNQIGLTPDEAFRRALSLQERGDLAAAEKIYRAIIEKYPMAFDVNLNLGTVLILGERLDEAIEVFRKALAQRPRSAMAHALIARALSRLDRGEEAMRHARRAVALDAKLCEAHATFAQILADQGHYDGASRAMARAIELAPSDPRLYQILGHIVPWRADDPRLARLRALGQDRERLTMSAQVELCFALAKASADCGDIDDSFRHLIEGGALKRRLHNFDEASTIADLDGLCRVMDAAWMTRHHGVGDPTLLPVFVLGMPRSGTTLVEQILASHPKVRGLGERLSFVAAIAKTCRAPSIPPSLASRIAEWSEVDLRQLAAGYLEAVRSDVPASAQRFTDKLPAHFQFVGLIHAALPNARIIHVRRDALDTCLSAFSILFAGASQPYSYDLGELGRYYRAYERVMAHWRAVLPDGAMLEVQYEDVVDDLEGEARRIIAYCGLEWDEACLTFHKTKRAVRTISHAQVRRPIYRSSIGRARPSGEALEPLLEALKPT